MEVALADLRNNVLILIARAAALHSKKVTTRAAATLPKHQCWMCGERYESGPFLWHIRQCMGRTVGNSN